MRSPEVMKKQQTPTNKPPSITTAAHPLTPAKKKNELWRKQVFCCSQKEPFHRASSSVRHAMSMGRQRQQQNKTKDASRLQMVSLWFLTIYSFKLKLKVMFCVQSFRTAGIHLSSCCCWEIYIFTCWMCKVDNCKLKIPTSCHSPCSLQIWWATWQPSAPNE